MDICEGCVLAAKEERTFEALADGAAPNATPLQIQIIQNICTALAEALKKQESRS